jgi:hypothetical protein
MVESLGKKGSPFSRTLRRSGDSVMLKNYCTQDAVSLCPILQHTGLTNQVVVTEHQLAHTTNSRFAMPPIVGAVVAPYLGCVERTRCNSNDRLYGLRACLVVRLAGIAAVGGDCLARDGIPTQERKQR